MSTPAHPHADRGKDIIIAGTVLIVFAGFFVMARLYTRMFMTKAFGWDDGMLAFAFASSLVLIGLTFEAVHYGYGQHILDITPPSNVPHALKFSNISIPINAFAMFMIKLSIGMSLLRIQLGRPLKIVIWFCIFLAAAVNLTAFVSVFGGCKPVQRVWDINVPGTCWSKKVNAITAYVQSVGNIITDVVFTFGPLMYLSKVKVSKYNQWALRGVFLLGLIATACAIVKVTELGAILKTEDPTWDGVTLTIWVLAEMCLGLFAASLPPLKASFERILYALFGIRPGFSGNSNYGSQKLPSGVGPDRHGYGDYAPGTRRSHHISSAAFGVPPSGHGHAAYVMDSVRPGKGSRTESDDYTIEDEERHILKNGAVPPAMGNGRAPNGAPQWGITKTVEYAVSDETSK